MDGEVEGQKNKIEKIKKKKEIERVRPIHCYAMRRIIDEERQFFWGVETLVVTIKQEKCI